MVHGHHSWDIGGLREQTKANVKILFPEESNLEIIVSKDTSRRHLDQALVVRADLSKTLLTGESSELGVHALELLYGQTACLIHDHLRDGWKRAEALRIAQAEEERKAKRAKEEEDRAKKTREHQDKLAESFERMVSLEQNIQHLQENSRPFTPTTTITEATPTEAAEESFSGQGIQQETRPEGPHFNIRQLERLVAMYTEAIANDSCASGQGATLDVTRTMEDFLATIRHASQ